MHLKDENTRLKLLVQENDKALQEKDEIIKKQKSYWLNVTPEERRRYGAPSIKIVGF